MFLARVIILFFLITCGSQTVFAETKEQKAVLVTGASSGLGLKMVETLSASGFFVYAGVRKAEDAKRLNKMPHVEALQFDVRNTDEIAAAAALVEKRGRGLYGLVNNAGVAVFGPLLEVGVEQLDYQMDVNVYGPYRVTQAFAPMIIKSKGRIATTGSIAGISSAPMYGIYAMSKHAIEAYTESLAAEMARFDVTVSVVEPGNYGSRIGETAFELMQSTNYWPESTQYAEERKQLEKGLPLVAQGKDPQDVADAVLDIMQSDTPKLRYLVAPNEAQAERTLRRNIRKTLQLNQDQVYSYDVQTLIKFMNEEAAKLDNSKSPKTAR